MDDVTYEELIRLGFKEMLKGEEEERNRTEETKKRLTEMVKKLDEIMNREEIQRDPIVQHRMVREPIPIVDKQDQPNEGSANRLKESRQTIKRTEQENQPCVKENDFVNSFGKSGVKPRGKIPNRHTKILRKHYLSIMENIRVDDIVDHLFSSEVIDLNEMDVLMSKLKSEGNRQALRHLMYILFNSSHRALPTFISCLNQTGYSYVAELLQDPVL